MSLVLTYSTIQSACDRQTHRHSAVANTVQVKNYVFIYANFFQCFVGLATVMAFDL